MKHNRKKALITGGAQRIGAEISSFLASCGWDIIIHYNTSKEEAILLKEDLHKRYSKKFNSTILIEQADLTVDSQIKTLINNIFIKYKSIDLLINNASLFINDNIYTCSTKSFYNHFDIHLKAPIFLIQELLLKNIFNDQSNIINILDYAIFGYSDKFLSYSLSKASLYHLTKILALKLAPNIRANALSLGHVIRNNLESEDEFQKKCLGSPLKKTSTLSEIMSAINFILESESMTGQIITLDGGKNLLINSFYPI